MDAMYEVPSGKLAAVATILEMRRPPALRPVWPGLPVSMRRISPVDPAWYLSLFRRIGRNVLWSARLAMAQNDLQNLLRDPQIEIYAVEICDEAEGLVELDFRTPGECELSYFGLSTQFVGAGIGRWTMNHVVRHVWSHPINRFSVHTCTLDHSNIVPFYIRTGFQPVRRIVEFQDDPRVSGLVERDAAPQIPII